MSETQVSGMPHSNPHLIDLLDDIRKDVVHILRQDQQNPHTHRAVELGLETLKIAADTVWRAVDAERLRAETVKIKAYTEQMKAETEKILAQKK